MLTRPPLSRSSRAERAAVSHGSWTWSQHWLDLLFLHWQVPVWAVQPQAPAGLDVQTYEGKAWLGLVLFRLKVRPRWLPFLPGLSSLTEVNLRTYVQCQGRPGICFLSVHADNRWAMRLARLLTPLPYAPARIRYRQTGSEFSFEGHGLTPPACRLSLAFWPTGESWTPPTNSLDAWLLERYRLFVACPRQGLLEATVTHPRWAVQNVEVRTKAGPWWNLGLSRPPDVMHYSPGVQALFGAFRPASERRGLSPPCEPLPPG